MNVQYYSYTSTVYILHSVPQPLINISQSMEGSVSGLDRTLTCSVMAIVGVSSHLMMVNWTGGSSLPESPRVSVSELSNNMSLFTRTVTFSPLLNDDAGWYNCTVSVTGFDEATTSNNVTIVVNGMGVINAGYLASSNKHFGSTVTPKLCLHMGSTNFLFVFLTSQSNCLVCAYGWAHGL